MASLFRRTRLYAQVQEACGEYRRVRIREHRAALKIKRQLVRMQVIAEIQRSRVAELELQMEAARAAASLAATRNVLEGRRARRDAMQGVAKAAGASLPDSAFRKSSDERVPVTSDEVPEEHPEQFKARMAKAVHAAIPADARGVAGGRLIDSLMEESVRDISLDPKEGREGMGVGLAVALAKQAGVGEKDLRNMLDSIREEGAADANDYLREKMIPLLDEESKQKGEVSGKEASRS